MNIVRSGLILLLLPLLLWSLQAAAAVTDEIHFKKGEAMGTVRGQVTTTKTYQFRARKGQSFTVNRAPDGGDKGNLTLTLYAYCGEEFGAPLVSESLRWEGKLPCTDKYTVDVTPSREAMQAARSQRYALQVTIR